MPCVKAAENAEFERKQVAEARKAGNPVCQECSVPMSLFLRCEGSVIGEFVEMPADVFWCKACRKSLTEYRPERIKGLNLE